MQTGPSEYRFGRFTLQTSQRQLLADGLPVKLGARAFDLLLTLIEHRDRVVSKNELLDQVWPGVVVAENNLEVHIWALRKLLGARAIVTIPGRGYRFTLLLDEPAFAMRPASAPAWSTTMRTNLPEHLSVMIGRDEDLAALDRLVDAQALVTIVGAGGIGKTLLALHLLERQRRLHTHGVCWVELGDLNDASLVVGTVAGALGLPLGSGDPLAALAAAMAPLELLLALDNAEHLLPEVGRVAEYLLAHAGGVKLLATSQAPLKLAQECQYRLGPLATPEHEVSPAEAMRYGGVALFVRRARAAQRQFELTDDNVAAVCTVCRRLDGCALAIELAAARLPLLGAQRLADSLDDRLHLLTKGHREAPQRQQTLRAGLQWSYALLNTYEQTTFRRLAVFAGGCSLELAEAVLAARVEERWPVIEALDRLVDLSLVAAVGPEPRYRLLASPHALAREQLAASGEQAELQARHARAVRDRFVALFGDLLAGHCGQDLTLALLEADLDNARAAMAWALQHDDATALALMRPMSLALTADGMSEADVLWERTETCVRGDIPSSLRLQWTLGAAVHYSRRRSDRASLFAERAEALARELGDEISRSRALAVLVVVDRAESIEAQRAAMNEMLRLDRSDWPPYARLTIAQAEAKFTVQTGDLARIGPALAREFMLAEAAGSSNFAATTQANMAEVALASGDAANAVRLWRASLQHRGATRRLSLLAQLRLGLARALLATEDLPGARESARIGWTIAPAPRADLELWALLLALLAARDGRMRTGARLLACARAAFAASGEPMGPNETRTVDEVVRLVSAALDAGEIEQMRREGEALGEDQIGALGFAADDT